MLAQNGLAENGRPMVSPASGRNCVDGLGRRLCGNRPHREVERAWQQDVVESSIEEIGRSKETLVSQGLAAGKDLTGREATRRMTLVVWGNLVAKEELRRTQPPQPADTEALRPNLEEGKALVAQVYVGLGGHAGWVFDAGP